MAGLPGEPRILLPVEFVLAPPPIVAEVFPRRVRPRQLTGGSISSFFFSQSKTVNTCPKAQLCRVAYEKQFDSDALFTIDFINYNFQNAFPI